MNKILLSSLLVTILAISGIFFLLHKNQTLAEPISSSQSNVIMVDGTQQIVITAKGGYTPQNTLAKANLPTVLKVTTDGTYDCSSALTIPVIGFRKALPASGTTSIEIPPQQSGATVKGVCGMGMYHFVIQFN